MKMKQKFDKTSDLEAAPRVMQTKMSSKIKKNVNTKTDPSVRAKAIGKFRFKSGSCDE